MTIHSRKTRLLIASGAAIGAVGLLGACSVSASTGSSSDPTPNVSVSIPGGGSLEAGGSLPANWPSDVPTPNLPVKGGVDVSIGMSAAFAGPGTVSAIQSELADAFEAQGWTSGTTFGGDTGGVTVWEKGSRKVQVTMTTEGSNVAVSETILNG